MKWLTNYTRERDNILLIIHLYKYIWFLDFLCFFFFFSDLVFLFFRSGSSLLLLLLSSLLAKSRLSSDSDELNKFDLFSFDILLLDYGKDSNKRQGSNKSLSLISAPLNIQIS